MFTIVAAVAKANNSIGYEGFLPWSIPEETALFRALSLDKPIIFGRKTFENLRNLVVTRKNITIISRDEKYSSINTKTMSLPDALAMHDECYSETIIGGGAEIYQQTIKFADRMFISWIEGDHPGDTYFPEINGKIWKSKLLTSNNKFSLCLYEK